MKKVWGLLFCCSLLAACNDTENRITNASKEDTEEEEVVDNELAVVKQSFPQLFQYLKKQDSTFSEDSFLLAGENKVETVPPSAIDSAKLKPFQKYLIYNSDSTLALDLYSYNYIATTRNGQNRLEEAGPDSEAAVLDLKKGTRRRVFFGGPSQTLWDARWTKPNELLLIGAEVQEDKVIPSIWQVNLQDTSMQVFAYQGEVKADMNAYTAQKLDMSF